jgi:hypothetical protein
MLPIPLFLSSVRSPTFPGLSASAFLSRPPGIGGRRRTCFKFRLYSHLGWEAASGAVLHCVLVFSGSVLCPFDHARYVCPACRACVPCCPWMDVSLSRNIHVHVRLSLTRWFRQALRDTGLGLVISLSGFRGSAVLPCAWFS